MNRRLLAGCVVALTLALIGACACAGYAFVEIGNKARTETITAIDGAKINAIVSSASTAVGSLNTAIGELTDLEGSAKDAIKTINDAAKKEAVAYDPAKAGTTANYLQRSARELHDLIGATSINLNGGLSPVTRREVEGAIPKISDAADSFKSSSDALTVDLRHFTPVEDALLLDEQELGIGAKAFAEQMPLIMKNGAQVSDDTVRVADHYERVILAPVSKLKAAVLFGASVAQHLLGL